MTSFHDFVSISFHLPPSPIPRIPPKVAPKRATKTLPSHGLTAKNFPCRNEGRNKDRFAHHLKVANRSFSVAETSPARAGAQRSERSKGGDSALGDSKGRSPWRFFGDFLIGEKVTRVQGGAPASGGVQRGAAPRMVGAGPMSLQNPPGRGAERPHLGRSAEEGPGPPRKEASECPSAERKRGKEKGPHQRGPLKI